MVQIARRPPLCQGLAPDPFALWGGSPASLSRSHQPGPLGHNAHARGPPTALRGSTARSLRQPLPRDCAAFSRRAQPLAPPMAPWPYARRSCQSCYCSAAACAAAAAAAELGKRASLAQRRLRYRGHSCCSVSGGQRRTHPHARHLSRQLIRQLRHHCVHVLAWLAPAGPEVQHCLQGAGGAGGGSRRVGRVQVRVQALRTQGQGSRCRE